jgi:hypothetical protein
VYQLTHKMMICPSKCRPLNTVTIGLNRCIPHHRRAVGAFAPEPIIIRMSAIRKLAGEAADNGVLRPELAAGISRVKSAKSVGIQVGKWL